MQHAQRAEFQRVVADWHKRLQFEADKYLRCGTYMWPGGGWG